jgi:hypothetical protein
VDRREGGGRGEGCGVMVSGVMVSGRCVSESGYWLD